MKKHFKAIIGLTMIVALFIASFNTVSILAAPKAKQMTSVTKEIRHASPKHPIIFSHRGSPYDSPEHSFQGYDHAIEAGSDFIEQDLWLSKDNKLYVTHDNNLKRTTGKNINVSDSTAQQLDKVKLRNGEHLHQLNNVFKHYGKNVHYIIESKKNHGANLKTEKVLAQQLNQYHMNHNVVIQDTDVNGIKYLHSLKKQKHVPYLYLMSAITPNGYLTEIKQAPGYITFLSLDIQQATPTIMKAIHQRGMLSDLWTAQSYNDNYSAIKVDKADSLFTNNTGATKHLIKEFNK